VAPVADPAHGLAIRTLGPIHGIEHEIIVAQRIVLVEGQGRMRAAARIAAHQVFIGLATLDYPRMTVAHEDDRRPQSEIVVAGHGQCKSARHWDGEQISTIQMGQVDVSDQDVARFTIPPGQGHPLHGPAQAALHPSRGILRPIQRRPDVVGHAAVKGHVGAHARDFLACANGINRYAGLGDERPSGLDDQMRQAEMVLRTGGGDRCAHCLEIPLHRRGCIRLRHWNAPAPAWAEFM